MIKVKNIKNEQKQDKFLKFITIRNDSQNILKDRINFSNGRRVKFGWSLMQKAFLKKNKVKGFWKLCKVDDLYKQKKWRERINFYAIQELRFNKLSHEESYLHETLAGSGWEWEENEPPTKEDFEALYEASLGYRKIFEEDIIDLDDRFAMLETEEEFFLDEEVLAQLEEGEERNITETEYNQKVIQKLEKEDRILLKAQDAIESFVDVYGLKNYSLYPIWDYNKETKFIEKKKEEIIPEKYEYLKKIIKIEPTVEAQKRVLLFNAQLLEEKINWENLKSFREYQMEKKLVQVKIVDYFVVLLGFIGIGFFFKSNIYKRIQEWVSYVVFEILHDIQRIIGDMIPQTSLIGIFKEDLTNVSPDTEQWLEYHRRLIELPFTNSIDVLFTFFTTFEMFCKENSEKIMELAKYLLEIY